MSGLLMIIVVVLLIIAMRLSYKIEQIARGGKEKSFPTYTNFFSTAFGAAGATSPETIKLRTQMRWLLLACLLIFVLHAVFIVLFAAN